MSKVTPKRIAKIAISASVLGAAIFGATELAKNQYNNSNAVKGQLSNANVSQTKLTADTQLSMIVMNENAWDSFQKSEYLNKAGLSSNTVAAQILSEYQHYILPIYNILFPTASAQNPTTSKIPTWCTDANKDLSAAIKALFLHDPFSDPLEIFKTELKNFVNNNANFRADTSHTLADFQPLINALNAHLHDQTKLELIQTNKRYQDLENLLTAANISFNSADDAYGTIFGQTFNVNIYEFFHDKSNQTLPSNSLWFSDDAQRLEHFIDILLRPVNMTKVEDYYSTEMTSIGESYKQKLKITNIKKFDTDVNNILSANKTTLFNRVETNVDKTKPLDEKQVLAFLPYKKQPESSKFQQELDALVAEYEDDAKSLENYITKQVSSAVVNRFINLNVIKIKDLFDKKQAVVVNGTTINVAPLTWFMTKYQIDEKDIDNVLRVTTGPITNNPAYKGEVFEAQYECALVSTTSNFASAKHTIEITTNVTDLITALNESQTKGKIGDLIAQNFPALNQVLPVTISDLKNMVGSSSVDIARLENFAGDINDRESFSGIIKHFKDNVLPQLDGKVTAVKPLNVPSNAEFDKADVTFEFTDSVNTAPITIHFDKIVKEVPKTAKELADQVDKAIDKKYIDLENAKKVLGVAQADTMNFSFTKYEDLVKIGLGNVANLNWALYKIEGTFTYTMGTFFTDLNYKITNYKDAKNFESRTVKVDVKELDDEKTKALSDINKAEQRFMSDLNDLSSDPDSKITPEQKTILESKISESIDAAKLAVANAQNAADPGDIAEKVSSQVMKKALPAIYFMNTEPGQEAIKAIFPDFSKFDINNPEFSKLLKVFDEVYKSDEYKNFDWSSMTLEDFKKLGDKLETIARKININTIKKINTAVLATMTALGGVFGLVGIGTGISSVVTAKADKKLKQKTNSVVKFQGIKKLISFQGVASLLSLGMGAIMIVYVFIIKGGF